MEEGNKLPLKRVELSLTKFNEVAIPHHLNLLRQHKANIVKYEEACDYTHVRSEQTHARRVASQLRTLLGELDTLRRQVRTEDVAKFDSLTQRSRDHTLRAIMDYLESSPMCMKRASTSDSADVAASTDSVGLVADDNAPQIQLQIDEQELVLREREAVLRGWADLQGELRALHDTWQTVQAAALAHKGQVSEVSRTVEVTDVNVEAARKDLALAERVRGGVTCAVCAAALAAGGPVGLALGLKAGAAAGLVASLAGYLAASVIGKKRRAQLTEDARAEPETDGESKKER